MTSGDKPLATAIERFSGATCPNVGATEAAGGTMPSLIDVTRFDPQIVSSKFESRTLFTSNVHVPRWETSLGAHVAEFVTRPAGEATE